MASIGSDPNGNKRVLFVAPDGRRKTLRLGTGSETYAGEAKAAVEHLLDAMRTGSKAKTSTLAWVEEQEPKFREKLVKLGLIAAPDEQSKVTIKAFTDRIIAQKTKAKAKPRTLDLMYRAADNLILYFGADKPLDAITPGDAKAFREHLLIAGGKDGKPLGENTVNGKVKVAKAFFNAAVEYRLLVSNPFAKLPSTVRANKSRMQYVSREDVDKVIDAAGDVEFQLLIALCRYAGLRNPSETLALRWEHIDLPNGRMAVQSPKTEHHANKASRLVPIFPALRPYLEHAWELCGDRDQYVIRHCRDSKEELPHQNAAGHPPFRVEVLGADLPPATEQFPDGRIGGVSCPRRRRMVGLL